MKIYYILPFLSILTVNLYSQNLYIKAGTRVTEKAGTQLNFINGSNLVIRDSPTTAPSFLQEGLINFSGGGEAQVEQYLTKETWNSVSSPMSDAEISAYEWMYLIEYNEPDNSWSYLVQPTTQPLNKGEGYLVWPYITNSQGYPPSPDSAVFKGNLNYQDINLTLSNTDASPKSGWNLVGNPFPVAVEWNGDASWNLSNVGAAMYIWDPVSGNYTVWNYNTGGTNSNGGYIAATQGFWVRVADTTGTAASMTLPASQRSHNDASFYKSGGALLPQQLLLTVANGTKNDKTVIGFFENATPGYDADYDATYLYGGDSSPALFSMISGTNYSLNELPSVEAYPVVPVGFAPKQQGTFHLTANWTESFDTSIPVWLEDLKDNVYHDLRAEPDYAFTANPEDNLHRFNVYFSNPMGMEEHSLAGRIHIYAYQKTVYVKFEGTLSGDIFIFNTLGEEIALYEHGQALVRIPTEVSHAMLIVKVITPAGLLSRKVMVR